MTRLYSGLNASLSWTRCQDEPSTKSKYTLTFPRSCATRTIAFARTVTDRGGDASSDRSPVPGVRWRTFRRGKPCLLRTESLAERLDQLRIWFRSRCRTQSRTSVHTQPRRHSALRRCLVRGVRVTHRICKYTNVCCSGSSTRSGSSPVDSIDMRTPSRESFGVESLSSFAMVAASTPPTA